MNKEKIRSVKALAEVLQRALQDKRFLYAWVTEQCKSQGNLAHANKPHLGITPMSLNTLKEYANQFIDGGFEQLDQLRKDVLDKAETGGASLKKTKTERTANKISDLNEQLRRVHEQKAVLQRAYFELNQLVLEAIPNSPHHQKLLERHNELYENYFRLRMVEDHD